jgi:acyl carrier protein
MSTEYDELTENVINIVATTMLIPVEEISAESTYEELGVDSLGGLTIIGELEDAFGIEIPNEKALEISSIPQTIACLRLIFDTDLSRLEGGTP